MPGSYADGSGRGYVRREFDKAHAKNIPDW